MRQRALGGIAMIFASLLTVSVSMPALAVNSSASGVVASGTKFAHRPQSFTVSAAESTAIQRDGFTVQEAPLPQIASAQTAGGGALTSLDLGQLGDQGWALPLSGTITSPFGPRPNKPVDGVSDYHNGTDIAAGCGKPVYAATAGTVIEAGSQGSYGNWVLIDHGDGVQTGYAHNSEILVSEGQNVAAGTNIALVGSTGSSNGCHVHFETRIDGDRINPESFLKARGITLG